MMLGQVFNNITYNRRLSVPKALMKEHKSKARILKRKLASSLRAIKSCLGRTSQTLEQFHNHRGNMVRVIKSPYLNTPQLLDVDRSQVHPLVRNLFHVKEN